jgi:transcriptional regulator MraZ
VPAAAFTGSYSYHLDEKGRAKLPPALAAGLGAAFVATRGLDGCLWLLPQPEWERFLEQLAASSLPSRSVRRLQRYFVGSAVACSIDPQGRLALPPLLRSAAGLNAEIILAGVGSRVEVWSPERWRQETGDLDDTELDELLRGVHS